MEAGRVGGAKGTGKIGEHNLLASDSDPAKHIDEVKLTVPKTS